MKKNIQIIDIQNVINNYCSIIFWIITLIFSSSFSLFKDINIMFIHNILLPIILICSGLCICFLCIYNYLFIFRNLIFNNFYKFIKSKLDDINDKEYIQLLEDCKIKYKEQNDIIKSNPSVFENICYNIYKYLFIISILLFIILFCYSYINGLI